MPQSNSHLLPSGEREDEHLLAGRSQELQRAERQPGLPLEPQPGPQEETGGQQPGLCG